MRDRPASQMAVTASIGNRGSIFFVMCLHFAVLCCMSLCCRCRPDGQLITEEWADMELDDVNFSPQFESILSDSRWVDDATGEQVRHLPTLYSPG